MVYKKQEGTHFATISLFYQNLNYEKKFFCIFLNSSSISFHVANHSQMAIERGILNEPDAEQREAIQQLVDHLLQPLRERVGEAIAITSGFRNQEVNRLVGGVPTSQHTKGEAADCYCASGPEHLLQVLLDSGLPFDQAIVYRRKRFLHLSYRQGQCRKMVLRKQ